MKRTLIYGTGSVQASSRRDYSPGRPDTRIAPPAREWHNRGANTGRIITPDNIPFTGRIEQPTYGLDLQGAPASDAMRQCANESICRRFNNHRADTSWRMANTISTVRRALK